VQICSVRIYGEGEGERRDEGRKEKGEIEERHKYFYVNL
jgi:hypothetical protein